MNLQRVKAEIPAAPPRPPRGFTIIELLIAIAVAAVLLSLAAPSFQTAIKNNRLYTHSNDLYLALMRARSEALARVARVTVCASVNQTTCSGTNWETGWIVFAEDTSSENAQVNTGAGDEIILVQQNLPNGFTLRGTTNVASYVSYLGDGLTTLTSGAFQVGNLVLCDDRGIAFGRGIKINAAGRPRVVEASEDAAVTTCTP